MTEVRHDLTNIANQVVYGGKRVFVKKNGKPAFALVSIRDVETLEALEDKIDVEDALKSLKDAGSISLKVLRKKFGL